MIIKIMHIISHRGIWTKKSEQNSIKALSKSLDLKFGIEFDVRDFNSKIVISHDMPTRKNFEFKYLLDKIQNKIDSSYLAINIKSDGLHNDIKKTLKNFNIKNYFVFDMSVPDGIQYMKNNINYFSRESEYETEISLYQKSKGVWIDQFKKNWIKEKNILKHHSNNKKICIVSPELHKRKYKSQWLKYKNILKKNKKINLMLCTDFPIMANSYFNY